MWCPQAAGGLQEGITHQVFWSTLPHPSLSPIPPSLSLFLSLTRRTLLCKEGKRNTLAAISVIPFSLLWSNLRVKDGTPIEGEEGGEEGGVGGEGDIEGAKILCVSHESNWRVILSVIISQPSEYRCNGVWTAPQSSVTP